MRLFRPLTAVVASSALAATAFTGPATAQAAAGVGTSVTSTKVLEAKLGQDAKLLDLLLLGDQARSTIDPAVASPEAFTRLSAVSAKTALLPGNPINIDRTYEAKSTGPTAYDIAAVPAFPAALGPVLSGTLSGGSLTAAVENGAATSGLNVSLDKLNAVGGLISLGSLKSNLSAASTAEAATSNRSASINDLTVLDLGALLQGLGISLPELTPFQLAALVDQLGATAGLPLPSGEATMGDSIASIQGAIDDLQGSVAGAPQTTAAITGAIDSTTGTVLGAVGVTSPLPSTSQTVTQATATVNALVEQLQAELNALLGEGLKALDGLALLRLEGVEVGVVTKAVGSVDDSVASVTGRIGKVYVGNVALPGVDLMAAASTVNSAVANINDRVSGVLSLVDPGLADLVKVSVLEKTTSVTRDGGYTRSRAGITGASAVVTPPAQLAAIVATIEGATDSVADTLSASAVKSLGLSSTMDQLASSLKVATSALTSPAQVHIASVQSASDFAQPAAVPGTEGGPVGTSELPRTGGPATFAILGGLAAVLALGLRRWTQAPELRAVRTDKA